VPESKQPCRGAAGPYATSLFRSTPTLTLDLFGIDAPTNPTSSDGSAWVSGAPCRLPPPRVASGFGSTTVYRVCKLIACTFSLDASAPTERGRASDGTSYSSFSHFSVGISRTHAFPQSRLSLEPSARRSSLALDRKRRISPPVKHLSANSKQSLIPLRSNQDQRESSCSSMGTFTSFHTVCSALLEVSTLSAAFSAG
jgi:hypothetical protein